MLIMAFTRFFNLQRRENNELLARCEEKQEMLKDQGEQLVEKEMRVQELMQKMKVSIAVTHSSSGCCVNAVAYFCRKWSLGL